MPAGRRSPATFPRLGRPTNITGDVIEGACGTELDSSSSNRFRRRLEFGRVLSNVGEAAAGTEPCHLAIWPSLPRRAAFRRNFGGPLGRTSDFHTLQYQLRARGELWRIIRASDCRIRLRSLPAPHKGSGGRSLWAW